MESNKIQNNLFLFILLIIFTSNALLANEIESTTKEILKSQFGENIKISYEKISIEKRVKEKIENQCQQRFFDDNLYLWRVESNDSLKGIALMDNVYGKTLPITFLVIFNFDGSVLSSHIIKYREDHGGAVASSSWNQQFEGKNSKSSFKIGEEIHGISGATISVRSITKGIQKLILLYQEIKEQNE